MIGWVKMDSWQHAVISTLSFFVSTLCWFSWSSRSVLWPLVCITVKRNSVHICMWITNKKWTKFNSVYISIFLYLKICDIFWYPCRLLYSSSLLQPLQILIFWIPELLLLHFTSPICFSFSVRYLTQSSASFQFHILQRQSTWNLGGLPQMPSPL